MNKPKNVSELHDMYVEKQIFFSKIKKFIKNAAWVMGILFSGIQFKQLLNGALFPIDDRLSVIIFKLTVAFLYVSWVYGLTFDLNDEEYQFKKVPNKGKLSLSLLGVSIAIVGVFAILFFLTDLKYLKLFVVVLTIFCFLGRFGEIVTGRFFRKAFDEHKKAFPEYNYQIDRLFFETIEQYILGSWLKMRFYIGTILIIIIDIFTFTSLSRDVSEKMNLTSENLIIVCLISIYLFSMEGWNWYKRINRNIRLKVLKEIKAEYKIIKK
jgi:hypothetical protein